MIFVGSRKFFHRLGNIIQKILSTHIFYLQISNKPSSAVAIRGDIKSGSGYGNDLRSLHSAGGGRRPVKVWNAARTIRKALVVATYEEFQRKGREKVGLSPSEPVRVVLEGDGTQVRPIQSY